jgi:hypothetical protein
MDNHKISRTDLYEQAWKVSLVKIAEKYDIPYSRLYKLCKDNDIPVPPSGYWTKLTFGKPVEKTPLPESSIALIDLQLARTSKRKNFKTGPSKKQEIQKADTDILTAIPAKGTAKGEPESSSCEPLIETYTRYGQTYNKYNRKALYQEVWEKPVIEVAKRYGVSDVAIHKICKALNIPVPPRGYWAKAKANKPVKKTALPKESKLTEVIGMRTDAEPIQRIEQDTLAFLDDEERNVIIEIARQIQLPGERSVMPNEITAYKRRVNEWNTNSDSKEQYAQRSPNTYNSYSRRSERPFLAGVVSKELLPRAYRILGALYYTLRPLGGSVTENMEFIIRNEKVTIEIYERQTKETHKLTKKEEIDLRKYDEYKQGKSYWASKPNIRKYDYVFNGNLNFSIDGDKCFRDTDGKTIEAQLGDILIGLFEASDVMRIAREKREEAARQAEYERRLREARRECYNAEVDKTLALVNCANDYAIACQIRAYVSAVQNKANLGEEDLAWIEWASKKADWFDPVVAYKDDALGMREYNKNVEQKELKHSYGYW